MNIEENFTNFDFLTDITKSNLFTNLNTFTKRKNTSSNLYLPEEQFKSIKISNNKYVDIDNNIKISAIKNKRKNFHQVK